MKKYLGFLIVLTLFVLGASNAQATSVPSVCASTATPSITILSPNGGEVYNYDGQIPVKWTSCNVLSTDYLRVALLQFDSSNNIIANVSAHTTTGPGVQNSGSTVIYDLPNTGGWGTYVSGNHYKISIQRCNPGSPTNCTGDLNVYDTSDNLFTINSSFTTKPSIKVLSPNGGEVYNVGQQITVKWNSTGIPSSEKVVIVLDPSPETNTMGQDGYNMSGSDGTVNDGIETYTLSGGVYGKFKIRILQLNNNTIKDSSDDYFTIGSPFSTSDCLSTSAPSVTVLSPNGGEIYQSGQQIIVKWKSCNSTVANVLIGLRSTVLNEGVEITTTQNDGEEKITLPTYMGQGNQPLVSGSYYKIGIELGGNPNWSDNSDNTFTINSLSVSSVLPDGCNSSVGFSATTGLPCFIDTNLATSISKNSAFLNGRLIANAPTEVYFMYKKAGNGNEMLYTNKISKQTNGLFFYALSNLSSNTEYQFRACMYYMGAERCAKLLTFKTLPSSDIQIEETISDSVITGEGTGCSNGEKYSSTTGQICTLYGCQHGENYSSTTGQMCKPESSDPLVCCESYGYGSLMIKTSSTYTLTSKSKCSLGTAFAGGGKSIVANSFCSTGNTSVSTPTKASIQRVLKIGTKGEDVKTLQSFLNLSADGSFGPQTMSAVKSFQQKNNLTADGVVGPKTISLFK